MESKVLGLYLILLGTTGIVNSSPFWSSSTEVDDNTLLLYDHLKNQNFPSFLKGDHLKTIVDGIRSIKRSNNNFNNNVIDHLKTEKSFDEFGSTISDSSFPPIKENSSSEDKTAFTHEMTKVATNSDQFTPKSSDASSDLNPTINSISSDANSDLYRSTRNPMSSDASSNLYHSTPNPMSSDASSNLYHSTPNPMSSDASSNLYHSTPNPMFSPASSDLYYSTPSPMSSDASSHVYYSTPNPVSSDASSDLYHSTPSPMSSDASSNLYHSTPNPVSSTASSDLYSTSHLSNIKTSSAFPNLESSSQGDDRDITSQTSNTQPGSEISTPDNKKEAISQDHIIKISSIRTARIIVSSIFIVIALIAAAILAVYLFTVKRRRVEYDQLLLLRGS